MTEHAVVIAGGGPTGLMLAGELAYDHVTVGVTDEHHVVEFLPLHRADHVFDMCLEG